MSICDWVMDLISPSRPVGTTIPAQFFANPYDTVYRLERDNYLLRKELSEVKSENLCLKHTVTEIKP